MKASPGPADPRDADATTAASGSERHPAGIPDDQGYRNLFALLCDWSPIGYAVLNTEGRFMEINEAGARLLGGERSDWTGQSLEPLLDPAQRDRVLAHLRDACAGRVQTPDEPCVVNVRLPSGGMDPTRLQFFSQRHPAGEGRLCLTAFQDISAEVQRQESERQRQAVLDALSAQIAVLDRNGRITAVNGAWRRFARDNGASRELESGIGLDYFEACLDASAEDPDQIAARAREGIQAVMRGIEPQFTLEYPCHSAQSQRWFLMTVTPLSEESGGAVVAHMDISERVHVEQENRRRREEVAHAARLSSVTVLAASLVHELSQPLAAASLFAEAAAALARKGLVDHNQLLSVVGDLHEQVERATGIVQGLRRFMRRGELKTEPDELARRIHGAFVLVRPLARRKRVRLELETTDELMLVQVNALQIEQVLVNLLCNAIEAIDRAGSPVRNIRVVLEQLGNEARITVADTGPGLDPEWVARIFDVFETEKETGMGMGLAISRTIIEAHGGKLWAETGVGPGAVLCFTLPLLSRGVKE